MFQSCKDVEFAFNVLVLGHKPVSPVCCIFAVHSRIPSPPFANVPLMRCHCLRPRIVDLSCLPPSSLLAYGSVSAIWDEDSVCPLCGQTQDRWEDHALSCVCGVCRHNAVRDVVHNVARDCCSLAPVKEKPGLLPPRTPDDADPPACTSQAGRPRPQPPSRHLGSSRPRRAGGGLGLLHQ